MDLETLRATEAATLVTLEASAADMAERERALREESASIRAAIDAEHVRLPCRRTGDTTQGAGSTALTRARACAFCTMTQ